MYDDLVKRLRNRRICIQQLGTLNDYPLLGEAADAIEELQRQFDNMNEANIALYGAVPKWIPVTEQLPLLNTPVLATDGIEVDVSWMYGVPPRWITSYTAIDEDKLTHWMPLPQTPRGGES